MSTQDWWQLKHEVRDRLVAAGLDSSDDAVDRIVLAARDRAVAQAATWWPNGPDGLAGTTRQQRKAASAGLSTDAKLVYVGQAIAARVHDWSNEQLRAAAPGLLDRTGERCATLAREAELDDGDARSLHRLGRRTLRANLAALDERLATSAPIRAAELDAVFDDTMSKAVTRGVARLRARADVTSLAGAFPQWLTDVVTEIVDHAEFDLARFGGDLRAVFDRELRRARSARGHLFDAAIAAELDALYDALRSDVITERTRARVLAFGRTRGHRLDLDGIAAYLLDQAERAVERAWTFRDKLLLGPHHIENPEGYGWRVVAQQLSTWMAEYSAVGPPMWSLSELELEHVVGPTAGPTTDAWFAAAERIADRAVVVLGRGGIELAGAIVDTSSIRLHPKQHQAFWEVIELAVVVKDLELELLRSRRGDRRPDSLDGLARLRAIVDGDGGRELKLFVHRARQLLDAEWRAVYPNEAQLPDSEDPEHFARYQLVRRRTSGQSTSSNPIIAGGVARLLSGLHHDISTAFGEETPQ